MILARAKGDHRVRRRRQYVVVEVDRQHSQNHFLKTFMTIQITKTLMIVNVNIHA